MHITVTPTMFTITTSYPSVKLLVLQVYSKHIYVRLLVSTIAIRPSMHFSYAIAPVCNICNSVAKYKACSFVASCYKACCFVTSCYCIYLFIINLPQEKERYKRQACTRYCPNTKHIQPLNQTHTK